MALIGVIFLLPVTKRELEPGIKEIIGTKPWSYRKTVSIRLICSVFLITLSVFVFALAMKMKNCVFPFWDYVAAAIFYAVFLGLLGLSFAQAGQNVIVGYLGALGYWALCKMGILMEGDWGYLFPVIHGSIEVGRMLGGFWVDGVLMVIFLWRSGKK